MSVLARRSQTSGLALSERRQSRVGGLALSERRQSRVGGPALSERRKARVGGPALSERRKARVEGFTLVEMLVVIVIIAILMGIAIAIVSGVVRRAQMTRTEVLIKTLSTACEDYRQDFDQYPPGQGSKALHQALGSPRAVPLVRQSDDIIYTKKGPLIEFRIGQLEKGAPTTQPPPASAIIDAWDNEIRYVRPGVHNKKGVDIWSDGPDKDKKEDDLTNWIGE
jgi:prepilin-type N-terminal cleavage/methylation domain-containing protein